MPNCNFWCNKICGRNDIGCGQIEMSPKEWQKTQQKPRINANYSPWREGLRISFLGHMYLVAALSRPYLVIWFNQIIHSTANYMSHSCEFVFSRSLAVFCSLVSENTKWWTRTININTFRHINCSPSINGPISANKVYVHEKTAFSWYLCM